MEISEWHEVDGVINLQCRRATFAPIKFVMNHKEIDSWQQVPATNKQREKLASLLYGGRVTLNEMIGTDRTMVFEMAPFAKRSKKPVDNRVKTRQLRFPGKPTGLIRMPVETRKRWGDNCRHEYLVEDVVTGKKVTKIFDPTQRMTQVDPNVAAEITGSSREISGDVAERWITWVGELATRI
jgi:hypothetical protein